MEDKSFNNSETILEPTVNSEDLDSSVMVQHNLSMLMTYEPKFLEDEIRQKIYHFCGLNTILHKLSLLSKSDRKLL